ncbi:MAG: hypothetical protein U9O55_04660, partial [Patescibacteria group bacterium]|nr:hypothetical protein [Patescibacteria group bacterium]
SEPKLNEEKTKNIILYFLNKLGGMSEKKLQMLLYFASYDYFEKEEEHLTGLVFYKTKNGIFIKKLNEILIKMIKQKEIKLI